MQIKYLGGYWEGAHLTIGKIYEVIWEGKNPFSGSDCYRVINDEGKPRYVRKEFCSMVEDKTGLKISW